MTWYHQQLLSMRATLYPHQDLVDRMVRAKRFIDEHYGSVIVLDTLAGQACMSKFHFIRLFTRYYGLTPNVYLRDVRMTHARKLLQQGIPIRHVCYAVGFDSIPSFTRLFKQRTGMTPKSAMLDKKVPSHPAIFVKKQ